MVRTGRRLAQTFSTPTPSFPIGVGEIRTTLVDLGIRKGDVLHVQSSLSYLAQGAAAASADGPADAILYASAIVDMLIDLIGPDGTILMNTDSLDRHTVNRLWARSDDADLVFDASRAPSNRGLVSEVFRRRRETVRSVHPWYNVTGWGKLARELLDDHERSTPYAMDTRSPWFKITEVGGKVLLLGRGFVNSNSPIHMVEFVHPGEYPRAVYLDKLVEFPYVDRGGSVRRMPLKLHAPLWWRNRNGSDGFCWHLHRLYDLYRVREFENQARIIVFDAKAQYEAAYREMKNNVTLYDPQFWPRRD